MSDRDMVDQVYGDGMARVHNRRVVAAAALMLGAAIGTSCSKAEASCGKPFAEQIDPNSSQHLLPGSAEPKYVTDPPTSGAHRPGEAPTGVLTAPIDRGTQVNALEAGRVLIQYRGISAKDRAALRHLGSPTVVVAPNDSLKTSVVATAWLFKLQCTKLDAGPLKAFIEEHAKKEHAH